MSNIIKKKIQLEGENSYMTVSLYYSLGGFSYWTYEEEPRGYYLSATPQKITEKDGYSMVETLAFSGIKKCILACNRKSKKREEEAIKLMPLYEDELVEMVLNKNGLKVA